MSKFSKPKIIDRRKESLGYPGRGVYARRTLWAIKMLVWHYTATTHAGYGGNVIKSHEAFWKGTHGWDIGGYHYYIDRVRNIFGITIGRFVLMERVLPIRIQFT